MYRIDLTNIAPKKIYPLDHRFRGTNPAGQEIGFTNYYMTLDSNPFYGISGEAHFCRIAPDQWEDAILKMKCGGINIVSTYVFWIAHEEEEGVFRFDGCRNLRGFLEVCEKHGMMVIMRVGPFAHGEFRNGGLPDWLYGKPYEVRNDNPGFLEAVRKYFRALHTQMDGHYYHQGGCIIGTQIDNEYEHSAAPWEITTGISSEWTDGGHSGESYLLKLKQIMQEEGIVTPFYTTTSWGGAVTPVEEALPLWGGYSYQPWIFTSGTVKEHPPTPEYIYRDNHNTAVRKTYNFEPTYNPETRPYACCEMMGGMMCSYKYRFRMDLRAIDALANTKLGSGCNLLGYYMYKGGTNPTGTRTPYLNENQISKRSYDYQAAIGEFGQIRESYGRLRAIHLFCKTFSGFLEETKAVLPVHLESLDPADLEPLRFSVRVKDGSGFLFVNNFQDHVEMRDRTGDAVTLQLPDKELTIRFDIGAGENAILPFNLSLGAEKLLYATAQPITNIGNTWFFLAPDGMQPQFCFETAGKPYTFTAEVGEKYTVGGIEIVTLSRKDSLGFNVYSINEQEIAILSENPVIFDGKTLKAETEDSSYSIYTYPADVLSIPANAAAEKKGVFGGYRAGAPAEPSVCDFAKVGVGRYTAEIPREMLRGHKQVLLRVKYIGDIGHAFINGEMISDNFANDGEWDIRLDCYAKQLEKYLLTIYITPIKSGIVVDVSAMAGRIERVDGVKAELLSAKLILIDEIEIPNK